MRALLLIRSRARLRNQQGIMLFEALIGLVLVAIFALGISKLFSSSTRINMQSQARSGLESVRSRIEECLRNDDGWLNTLQDTQNASMACLRDQASCKDFVHPHLPGEIKSVRSPVSGMYCLVGPNGPYDNTETKGFDRNGQVCNQSEETCLLKASVRWQPATSSCYFLPCVSPQVGVSVRFTVLPGKTAPVTINPVNYNGTFIRGLEQNASDRFLIVDRRLPGVSGGACLAGRNQWSRRTLLGPPGPAGSGFIAKDPSGQLLLGISYDNDPPRGIPSRPSLPLMLPFGPGPLPAPAANPNSGKFRERRGTYRCAISAPAYKVGRHQVRLVNYSVNPPQYFANLMGTSEYSINGQAGTQTMSVAQGIFTIHEDSVLGLEHFCGSAGYTGNAPVGAPDQRPYALGYPQNIAGQPEFYASIECARLR